MSLLFLIPLAYQFIALLASIVHRLRSPAEPATPLAVSVLKPIYGLDDAFYQAIESHALQNHPEFELLFGVRRPDDPAIPAIERLIAAYPERDIRLIRSTTDAPNGKVGVLADLAREARHDVLLVNDSDIDVPPGYLERVTAPLNDPGIGLVTCLYRAEASSLAGKWEALGISTDFIPSTLVAPLVGIREFGLGSTLCFRRADLERIGGFAAIAPYIADDYQLARRITAAGKRAHLSEVVVGTHLSDPDFAAVWRHQVRWARTIRVSRGDGFLGLPVTHAGLWALVALLSGQLFWALGLYAARLLMGVMAGWGVLRSPLVLRAAPLIPLWDVWAFAVWLAGLAGRSVEWRGQRLTLDAGGRLHK